MTVTENDPNEISANAPNESQDSGANGNRPAAGPYADAGNLYEIPRVRQDDPPMRNWWIDDEPQQEGSGQQNG
jgi:hypothetical protein